MKVCWVSLLVCTLFSVTTLAQNTPWWELYGGYQFASYRTDQMQTLISQSSSSAGIAGANVSNHLNMNGWNLAVQENQNSWFSGIIDFSGVYGNTHANLSQPRGTKPAANFSPGFFTMGGGPQFTYRKSERVQPFARIIFAAAYCNLNPNLFITNHASGSSADTDFALIGGGGIDYRLNSYAFFRIAGDYIHTSLFSQGQNNFRITAGIDFRIARH